MKSLGQIYQDSWDRKNKWYHIVWFYTAMVGLFIWLAPPIIWRKLTGRKTTADIEREKFMAERSIDGK